VTRTALILLAAGATAVGGCGAAGSSGPLHQSPAANAAARRLLAPGLAHLPTPPPTGKPANHDAVRVIRAWSSALRAGRVRIAASYFSLPSELINAAGAGGAVGLVKITTPAQAAAANETLPCGATVVSADQRGRYVNALFRLTGRTGPGGDSTCGGSAGQTARTNFLIVDGRIVEWIRAPDDPGDNGSPSTPPGSSGGAPLV
jgi:hypothetical protein